MPNLQLYSLLFVAVNGALLTEEGSVDVTRTTGSQAVTTVPKGYAGESPGAAMVEITVSNAIPSADFEFNPGPFMASLQNVEIGVIGPGGKQMKFKCFIIQDSFRHAVNSDSKLEFRARGQFADFE